jgi:type IV pilus assembly protein PilW
MNSITRIDRQRGLTLVEIMVALVISLFLLAGLLQMFIGTRQSSRVQENLSRVQENGRFAIDFVGRNIRLAGYRSRSTIEAGIAFEDKFPGVRAVQGTNDDGLNGSDTITVNFEGEGAGQGDIRNCLNAQINNSVTSNNIFSINTNASGRNELRCQSGAVTQTILEDVENLQILYGENTDGDVFGVADRYVPANQVGKWDRVVSLRISLLVLTSDNNLVADTQPYSFNGSPVIPTDRRLRRVFTTTITLRNRV